MLPFEDRYTRQRRLPEVGPSGQERLCAAQIVIPKHPDVELELDYLARAGVAHVVVDDSVDAPVFPFADWFEHGAALGVARGAWCALRRIKAELFDPSAEKSDSTQIL
jgi:hypothetical protein